MISYKQWKLLNESFGAIPLGLTSPQNLGLTGPRVNEMGMMPPMPKKRNRPMPDEEEEFGDEEGLEDELGDEEGEFEDEEGLEDEEGEFEDEEGSEDEEMPIDPDAELEDDLLPPKKKKKRFPMGEPHDTGPFMRKMKKEDCGEEEEDSEEEDGEIVDDEEGDDDKEVEFLQKKKQKKMKKKCSADMPASKKCAKCSKQKKMKEETISKEEKDFINSIQKMYGNPTAKHFSGITEDLLLPQPEQPQEPQPGQVGFAPDTRIGNTDQTVGESIDDLLNRINQLDKRLKER